MNSNIDLSKFVPNMAILQEVSIYSIRNPKKGELNYSIHVEPDIHRLDGYFSDPYIKVCDNPSWDKAKKSVRISMKSGNVIPSHNDGKKDLELTSDVKDFLNTAMKSQSSYYKGLTVYDAFYKFLEDNYSWHEKYKEVSKKYPYDCPVF